MKVLLSFLSVIQLVCFLAPLYARDKDVPRKTPFPFNIVEGAAQVTTSLAILPFEIAYNAAPAALRYERNQQYTQEDLDWKRREYAQLNWYDDIRRGYTQNHEWKEADEELYLMRRR
ncbi:MAG TPA: hypothetical protein P5287_01335 [bacterium]|nr:hypothetical protein [bacterium]